MQDLHTAPPRPDLPPFIHPDDMPDLYALMGVGTCMEPLIENGACCVFDKREAPKPGDIVGVIFTEAAAQRHALPGMLKRLAWKVPELGAHAEDVVLDQINPPCRYIVPARDVLAVHKFMGTAIRCDNGTAMFKPAHLEAA